MIGQACTIVSSTKNESHKIPLFLLHALGGQIIERPTLHNTMRRVIFRGRTEHPRVERMQNKLTRMHDITTFIGQSCTARVKTMMGAKCRPQRRKRPMQCTGGGRGSVIHFVHERKYDFYCIAIAVFSHDGGAPCQGGLVASVTSTWQVCLGHWIKCQRRSFYQPSASILCAK